HPQAPEGERAAVIAAVAAAIDYVLGERKRQISGQMNGRDVVRDAARAVWLGKAEHRLVVRREGEAISVHLAGEKGARLLSAGGRPAESFGEGSTDAGAVAVQVRPIANGFALSFGGAETKAYVYTERE